MSTNKLQIAVTFDTANRKKDRSVSLKFTTNEEIANAAFAGMDLEVGTTGWLLYSPNELTPDDIPEEQAPDRDSKPFAQRLRAVKYLQWLKGDQSEPFEIKWSRYKESVLEMEKGKLD